MLRRLLSCIDGSNAYIRTRNVFLRALGGIYFVAFLSLNRQVAALLGSDGLLPADLYLERLRAHGLGFVDLPSIFWWSCNDGLLVALSWVGLLVSALIVAGFANAIAMAGLWFLYMSFVHIGQVFYGYGWETMTLEAGFLAIFLSPLRRIRPSPDAPPPAILFVWLRWMLFRVMFGAGLIKVRGDDCWRDLTCLVYHYETQPIPNPLSWYLHQMPLWFHQAGVLFNHAVELLVPLFYFGPRRVRIVAVLLTILFQVMLILSGNLSWLNGLTIVIAIGCLDDRFLGARTPASPPAPLPAAQRGALIGLSLLLAVLSVKPILNMASPRQVMNTSFDRLHLLNTYGAFGSVGRVRNEIVLEGSTDGATWREYEFLAKPGDPARRPRVIAPYQSRIDWQVWFAAMQRPEDNPWLIHLIAKLLEGNNGAASLLAANPFDTAPPKYLRASLYRYRFASPDQRRQGLWWERERLGLYVPAMTRDDPRLVTYLEAAGVRPSASGP